jgi:hypothetical protein
MKDEIKKKIEEEALKYAESKSSSSVFYESHVKDFIKGAEFMHSLAQSANSELIHALKEIKEGVSEYQKDNKTDILDWVIKFADRALLSASKNQQNEKHCHIYGESNGKHDADCTSNVYGI